MRRRWGRRRMGADERRLDSSRRPIRRPRCGTVADAELSQPEDRLEHPYAGRARRRAWPRHRSEEHTSDLQSLMRISDAVLSLKKKKNTKINHDGEKNKN